MSMVSRRVGALGTATIVAVGVLLAVDTSSARADATIASCADLGNAITASGTVVLSADLACTNTTLTVGGTTPNPSGPSPTPIAVVITLDLHGHSLSITGQNDGVFAKAAVDVLQGASVTIESSTGSGSLVATGGNASGDQNASIGGDGIRLDGSLTLVSGTVTASGGNGTQAGNAADGGNGVADSGTLIVKGGRLIASGGQGNQAGNGAEGGTGIDVSVPGAGPGQTSTVGGILTVNGGTVSATGGSATGSSNGAGGGAGISGYGASFGQSASATLTFAGGTVSATGGAASGASNGSFGGSGLVLSSATLQISAGTFTATSGVGSDYSPAPIQASGGPGGGTTTWTVAASAQTTTDATAVTTAGGQVGSGPQFFEVTSSTATVFSLKLTPTSCGGNLTFPSSGVALTITAGGQVGGSSAAVVASGAAVPVQVAETEDGAPVTGATVTLTGTGAVSKTMTAKTDARGWATFAVPNSIAADTFTASGKAFTSPTLGAVAAPADSAALTLDTTSLTGQSFGAIPRVCPPSLANGSGTYAGSAYTGVPLVVTGGVVHPAVGGSYGSNPASVHDWAPYGGLAVQLVQTRTFTQSGKPDKVVSTVLAKGIVEGDGTFALTYTPKAALAAAPAGYAEASDTVAVVVPASKYTGPQVTSATTAYTVTKSTTASGTTPVVSGAAAGVTVTVTGTASLGANSTSYGAAGLTVEVVKDGTTTVIAKATSGANGAYTITVPAAKAKAGTYDVIIAKSSAYGQASLGSFSLS